MGLSRRANVKRGYKSLSNSANEEPSTMTDHDDK